MQTYQTTSWIRAQAHLAQKKETQPGFAQHLIDMARPAQIAYEALMTAYDGQPIGVECRSEKRDQWAFIAPNISEKYPFRIQIFDADGFISHHGCNTLELAVEDLINSGYRVIDAGALDRVSMTARWSVGIKRLDIMQCVHDGRLTWAHAADLLNDLPRVDVALMS
ncbi:hypothetical protein KDW40_02280 [Burkholderia cenocepacia]|uniref:hypothetical protein n=1 Tax=Burkholderia cenocepacia TaxID=95486 RepID=UPI001B9C2524|nr:hypothetical protein [Burkholderia cenocepacia]MBR8043393.1 hypothetical protein [Burkholderia cenocepacia]MBR8324558.1 hypothetical protein [Burkholderia cenocepacia]